MNTNESLGFGIACFVILTLVAGAIIAYLIYFNELRTGSVLTTTELGYIMIASVVLLLIVLAIWIWSGIRLFFNRTPHPVVEYHTVHRHHSVAKPIYEQERHYTAHPVYNARPVHEARPVTRPVYEAHPAVTQTSTGIPGNRETINAILQESGDQ